MSFSKKHQECTFQKKQEFTFQKTLGMISKYKPYFFFSFFLDKKTVLKYNGTSAKKQKCILLIKLFLHEIKEKIKRKNEIDKKHKKNGGLS